MNYDAMPDEGTTATGSEVHHRDAGELLAEVSGEILANSGTGVAVVDAELRFLAVNSVAAEINGLPPRDHVGRSVREVVPDVARELEPVLSQVLRSGAPLTGLEVVGAVPSDPDRTRYWNVSIAPAPGAPTSLVVVFVDVTAQRAVDQRLRTVLDSLFEYVGVLDRSGRVVEANSAALCAAGVALEEVQGRKLWDTAMWSWNPGVSDRLRKAVDEALGGASSRYDELVQLGGGRLLPMELHVAPMHDGDEVVGVVTSAQDISHRLQKTTRLESLALLSGNLAGCTTTAEVLETAVSHPGSIENSSSICLMIRQTGQIFWRSTGMVDAEVITSDPGPGLPAEAELALGCLRGGVQIEPGDADSATATALPLRDVDGRVVGAIAIRWEQAVALEAAARARLALVSDLVTQAVTRSAKVDELDELVAEISRHALSTNLDFTDLEVSVTHRPSADTAKLGGDWFDVVDIGSARVAVSLGDVAGHGALAAGRMAHIRGLMQGLLTSTPLGDLFDAATRVLGGDEPEMIATAAVTVIDTGRSEVRTVLAGHPPPVVRDDSGEVRRLEPTPMPPIGVPRASASEGSERMLVSRFEPGSTLVVYSDGLVENRRRSVDEGLAVVEETLRELPHGTSAGRAAEAILERLLVGEAEDDVALVVVRHLPAG